MPKRIPLLVLLAGFLTLGAIQFLQPLIWEADGYYHIHVADTIRREGFVDHFHWARFSVFAENFADKEVLYHVLLIPFTFLPDLFFGAKVAAWIFAGLLLCALYSVLKRLVSQELIPVFLVLFFCSDHFLSVLSRPRPMVPAIALMILGIDFLIRRKLWAFFWATLVYGFMHLTAPLMVFFAVLVGAVRFFEPVPEGAKRRYDYMPVLAALGAIAASSVLHPNFPDNLRITWLNLFLVPYYAARGGVLDLGAEFFPITTRELLIGYPLLLPSISILLACSLYRPTRGRFETRVFFFSSLPLLLGGFLSQRYLIHGYPLFLVWSALYATDFLGQPSKPSHRSRLSIAALCACLLVFFAVSWPRVQQRARAEHSINAHYERIGRWLGDHVPRGEVIFHANWSDSQYFIGINPRNDYFVTLDPVFMYSWNPDLYRLYRQVAYGQAEDPYRVLSEVFHVRYGYAGRGYFGRLIHQISQDPRFEILLEEPQGVIFRLK